MHKEMWLGTGVQQCSAAQCACALYGYKAVNTGERFALCNDSVGVSSSHSSTQGIESMYSFSLSWGSSTKEFNWWTPRCVQGVSFNVHGIGPCFPTTSTYDHGRHGENKITKKHTHSAISCPLSVKLKPKHKRERWPKTVIGKQISNNYFFSLRMVILHIRTWCSYTNGGM